MAVDREHLYWTNGLTIARSDLDGTGVDPGFVATASLNLSNSVVVDDRYIYWSNGTEIGRANIDGTDVTPDFISLGGDDARRACR